MKYASVLITVMAVWLSMVIIASMINNSETVTQLHRITLGFTVALFLIGFGKSR